MARPRQRTPELRDAIVDAAIEMFDRDGPAAVTTRSVAAAASTSPAAIAELLDGKEGLLAAIAASGFSRLDQRLRAVNAGSDAAVELGGLANAYRAFSLDHHHMFDLMFSRPVRGFGVAVAELDEVRSIYRAFTERFGAMLEVSARDRSAVDAATGFVALLHGLAVQERSGLLGSTTTSIERRWTAGVSIFLTGAKTT